MAHIDKIGGNLVVGSFRIPNQLGHRVVLVDRAIPGKRWATALHVFGADEWYYGHYFSGFAEAVEDFIVRVRKYTG